MCGVCNKWHLLVARAGWGAAVTGRSGCMTQAEHVRWHSCRYMHTYAHPCMCVCMHADWMWWSGCGTVLAMLNGLITLALRCVVRFELRVAGAWHPDPAELAPG